MKNRYLYAILAVFFIGLLSVVVKAQAVGIKIDVRGKGCDFQELQSQVLENLGSEPGEYEIELRFTSIGPTDVGCIYTCVSEGANTDEFICEKVC